MVLKNLKSLIDRPTTSLWILSPNTSSTTWEGAVHSREVGGKEGAQRQRSICACLLDTILGLVPVVLPATAPNQ